jgi:hypothetical protein
VGLCLIDLGFSISTCWGILEEKIIKLLLDAMSYLVVFYSIILHGISIRLK